MKTRRRRGWVDLALLGVMSVPAFVLSTVRPTLGIVPGVLFSAAALVLWFRPGELGQKTVPVELRQKTVRADQQALFVAHDRMLREAVDWLDATHAPIEGIGNRVLVGLLAKILQLGTALQCLCEAGHAGEATPIARAMVSACVTLVYIAEDRDNRAAAYMETDQLERKKRIRLYRWAVNAGKPFFWAEELADIERKDAELSAIQTEKFAVLAEHGVVPTRLGKRPDTVSGFNERELFDAMNATYWYQAYYKLFSDDVHVSSNALYTELVEQLSGQSLVGPKFEDPFHVLVASRDMVMNALEQIDRAFDLGQRDRLTTIDAPIRAALIAFREARLRPAPPVPPPAAERA